MGGAGGHQTTVIEQDELVAASGGQVEIVQDDDRRRRNGRHQGEQLELVPDVEVVGGLVEQQMVGVLGDGPSDERTLPFTAGQLGDEPIGQIRYVDASQRCVHHAAILGVPITSQGAVREPSQSHGVAYRERQTLVTFLGDDGYCSGNGPPGEAGDVRTVDEHLATGSWQGAIHGLDEGGLACPIGSDDTDGAAISGGQIHLVDHHPVATADHQGMYVNHGLLLTAPDSSG